MGCEQVIDVFDVFDGGGADFRRHKQGQRNPEEAKQAWTLFLLQKVV